MIKNTAKLNYFKNFLNPLHRKISSTSNLSSQNIFRVKSDNDFDEKVLKSEKPVLVGFFHSYCNLCNIQLPRAEKVASEYKDKFLMAKVDVEQAKELAINQNTKNVPTLVLVKDGKVLKELSGLRELEDIRNFVKLNII